MSPGWIVVAIVGDRLLGLGDREHRQRRVRLPRSVDRPCSPTGVGAACARRAGVRQRQVERERAALAGLLTSRISPPSRFASSRLIASPRPVPPYLRLVPASACWNASKMSFCFSGAMPMPVSDTSNAIAARREPSTG